MTGKEALRKRLFACEDTSEALNIIMDSVESELTPYYPGENVCDFYDNN